MNWQHFKTVLWLRWRIRWNQIQRGGRLNSVLMVILLVSVAIVSASMFFVALAVGVVGMRGVSSEVVLYVWDAVVVAFLFFWSIGLLTELQRSEVISIEKLLHLPISVSGAFLINYFSSLVCLSIAVFLPGMLGLSLALLIEHGPAMLIQIPLLLGLIAMVSAVTYQLRGWLATMMANKRKRRTIITVLTFGFILLCQLPNAINIMFLHDGSRRSDRDETSEQIEETRRLESLLASGEIDQRQYDARIEALQKRLVAERQRVEAERLAQLNDWMRIANLVFPPGWLPFGAMAAANGDVRPGLLGATVFGIVAAVSLRRSYRTTLRYYRAEFRTGSVKEQPPVLRRPQTAKGATPSRSRHLLLRQIPMVSSQVSSIALANIRSLSRAPEVKATIVIPFILVLIFGSTIVTQDQDDIPEFAKPLTAIGAIGVSVFAVIPIAPNQFGFDRAAFCYFVLAPIKRRDILFGKNLSMAPLVLVIGSVILVASHFVLGLPADHSFASLLQLVVVFLLLCIMGNQLSILVPAAVTPGSLKSSKPRLAFVLCQILFTFMLPLLVVPAFFAIGLELLLESIGLIDRLPVYAIASILELAAVIVIYKIVLEYQGRLMQRREQTILKFVASENE